MVTTEPPSTPSPEEPALGKAKGSDLPNPPSQPFPTRFPKQVSASIRAGFLRRLELIERS